LNYFSKTIIVIDFSITKQKYLQLVFDVTFLSVEVLTKLILLQ